MDFVFKEGILYLQGVKFGKKTWRKTWIVLFKPSCSGIGRLELYNVGESSSNNDSHQTMPPDTNRAERRVIRLVDCLSVTPAPGESCPAGCEALYLNTTLRVYTLASETCQDWICALCQLAFQKDSGDSDQRALERDNGLSMKDNELYSSWTAGLTLPPDQYYVTVQTTEASRRCKLAGEYIFSTAKEGAMLMEVDSRHTVYCWPYTFLRRFGQVKGGFSIEVGHRCDSGEGVFTFLSVHSHQIYQAIVTQCLAAQQTMDSPLNVQPPANYKSVPSLCQPQEAESDYGLYATINHSSVLNNRRPMQSSDEDEEKCQSMEAISMNDVGEDIAHLLKSMTQPRVKDQTEPEGEFSERVYSLVNPTQKPIFQSAPSFPEALSQSSIFPPQLQPVSDTLSKPRYQPVWNQTQPSNDASNENPYSVIAEENKEESEQARGHSPFGMPNEIPVSFKERLSQIISKDLAKIQSPPQFRGVDSLSVPR